MICHNLGHPSQRASSLAFVILATLTTPRANELIQYTHSQNSTTSATYISIWCTISKSDIMKLPQQAWKVFLQVIQFQTILFTSKTNFYLTVKFIYILWKPQNQRNWKIFFQIIVAFLKYLGLWKRYELKMNNMSHFFYWRRYIRYF